MIKDKIILEDFNITYEDYNIAFKLTTEEFPYIPKMSYRDYLEHLNTDKYKKIKYEDRVIGSLLYNINPIDNLKIYLYEIIIIEEYRNKGIGSYILKKLQREYEDIWLATGEDNRGAKRLYERLGFITDGESYEDEEIGKRVCPYRYRIDGEYGEL